MSQKENWHKHPCRVCQKENLHLGLYSCGICKPCMKEWRKEFRYRDTSPELFTEWKNKMQKQLGVID